MSNLKIQQHKFVVKAGMTVDDIKNSKEATVMQKKYASAFDTDGQKGFSQKEADLFNATTFSEKSDGTVIFWTRQKDGTKKGTKFDSNNSNIQFKSENEVKPYVKQVKVKKAAPKKEESVSFFDEKWSGHQIAKLTGDSAFTDWLQNKDKKSTDGKDDGKIGFWEGAESLTKGLIGGIPKAIINHPVATVVAAGLGAAATAVTGTAILPVLGVVGVVTGVGMAGYGAYKAVTAKTDGETKQALETLGMGITTTALSVASADKALSSASDAGVKSAEISQDANYLQKTVQMFKSVPEALKVSGRYAKLKMSSLLSSVGLSDVSQSFSDRKFLLEREIRVNLRKNVESGNLNKNILDPARVQKVIDSITEENIDLATKLLSHDVEYYMTNQYAKYSEDNVNYILETVPRLLNSKDPKLREAVLYIIDNKEISDNIFALNVVNENNAQEIMALKGTPFKDYQKIFPFAERYNYETLQQKMWKLYSPTNDKEELLPFTEDYSHKFGDKIYLKIYAKEGTQPNIPGMKVEEYFDPAYHITRSKYVIYQSASDTKHDIDAAQSIARGLLKEYGYKSVDLDAEKAIQLMKNGCRTQEEKQWLADFILSDKYQLIKPEE